MIFEEKKVVLKDGTSAVFRSPQCEDAENMLRFLKISFGETDFLHSTPEEFVINVEQEADFLENLVASHHHLMIACWINDEIVGNCMLNVMDKIKTRHRAKIAIAVLQKVWNKGIGTLLLREMIRIAQDKQLMQLELEYVAGNERAKHLYEKLGFEEFAERPNSIRLQDGTLLSEHLMLKQL